MKQKFDFVLYDCKYYRDVFRFYPRRTHVHGFYDNSPDTWDEVYKVYYSWAIIRQYYDDSDEHNIKNSRVLFDMSCDECSMVPNLSGIIKNVLDTGEIFDYPTHGEPAGDWIIEKDLYLNYYFDEYCEEYCRFKVFNSSTDQGYRFSLNKEETLKFCDWLDMINQYALKHSEGI